MQHSWELTEIGEKNGVYMGMEKVKISEGIKWGKSRGSNVPCDSESCLGAHGMHITPEEGRKSSLVMMLVTCSDSVCHLFYHILLNRYIKILLHVK
jgi:hypothetical protein